MRLLGAHCSTAGGLENAPRIANTIGAAALQLFTGPNQRWHAPLPSVQTQRAFIEACADAKLRATVAHACYLINLASPDPEIFEKSIAAMVGEVTRAEMLNIPHVIVHPGSHLGKGVDWGVHRVAEALKEILSQTAKCSCTIALETTAGTGRTLGHTFEQLATIMHLAGDPKRITACVDTCHIFAAGYELRTQRGYDSTWNAFDAAVGRARLIAIHVNDSKGEIGSRVDRHEHLGRGKIGKAGFQLLMRDEHLTMIPFFLETPKDDDAIRNDRKNLAFLRALIPAKA